MMSRRAFFLSLLLFPLLVSAGQCAGKPKRDVEPVELTGTASDFYYTRNWNSYYWREDFSFLLKDEKSGQSWRIISREPTPAWDWRMGTTFTGLKVDWKANPRVKIIGVTGVDRLPAEFYHFKLDEPKLATAFVVYVDLKKDQYSEYYVNNWFHRWGPKADKVIHQLYAGKKAPYDIYGFINGQAAPFSKKAQALIARHKGARMFHGLIHAAKENAFGYEIELLHLFGPDSQGNGVALYGDGKTVPLLDRKKPAK
jgi:hypothetical protein